MGQPIHVKAGTVEALTDFEGAATNAANRVQDQGNTIKSTTVIADGTEVGQQITEAIMKADEFAGVIHTVFQGGGNAAKIAAAQVDNLHRTDESAAGGLTTHV